jgi:hypothetical protein
MYFLPSQPYGTTTIWVSRDVRLLVFFFFLCIMRLLVISFSPHSVLPITNRQKITHYIGFSFGNGV